MLRDPDRLLVELARVLGIEEDLGPLRIEPERYYVQRIVISVLVYLLKREALLYQILLLVRYLQIDVHAEPLLQPPCEHERDQVA